MQNRRLLWFNPYRDREITIFICARNHFIFSRYQRDGYRIFKDSLGYVVNPAEKAAVGIQNLIVGMLRTIRVAAIKIGISFISGINYQYAVASTRRSWDPSGPARPWQL